MENTEKNASVNVALSKRLFEELNSKDVNYCHWKSNEHLIEGLNGLTDLDVLVDRNNRDKLMHVMLSNGFHKAKSGSSPAYVGIEDWIGMCDVTGTMIHIHLHYSLVTGTKFVKEYSLPWTKFVLEHSVYEAKTNVKITDPNIEIILLLLRLSIKATYKTLFVSNLKGKRPFSAGAEQELQYLLTLMDMNKVAYFLNELFGDSSQLAKELRRLLENGDISASDLYKIKKLCYKEFKQYSRYNRLSVIYFYLKNKVSNTFKYAMERLGFHPIRRKTIEAGGIVISLIGCDGAGKTTMLADLNSWLIWKLDTHQFYLGSGDNVKSFGLRFIKGIRNLVKRSKHDNVNHEATPKQEKSIEINKSEKPSSKGKSYLFFKALYCLNIGQEKWGTIKKVNRLKNKGSIVLTDRFPQTQFLGSNDSPGIKEYVLKYDDSDLFRKMEQTEINIYTRIIKYSPDVVIKLLIDPEVGKQRKPEHDIEILRTKTKIIKELEFLDSKVYEVDANRPLEEVKRAVRSIVWENL